MAESVFARIKKAVDQEKDKKVRGEARLASLQEEAERIFKHIRNEVGGDISDIERAEEINRQLKEEIEAEIAKMLEVLRSEGIEV